MKKGQGQAAAGFVLSLVGLVVSFWSSLYWFISLPSAIVGLCLSVVGGKQLTESGQKKGLATAGLVLGIIAIVFSSFGLLIFGTIRFFIFD